MRWNLLVFIGFLGFVYGQPYKLTGNWTGILTDSSQGFTKAFPVILQLKGVNGHATGVFRVETEDGFSQYEVSGDYTSKKHFVLQSALKPLMQTKNIALNSFDFTFHFQDSSEYVTGIFHSLGCPFHQLNLYLERDDLAYTLEKNLLFSTTNVLAMAHRIQLGVPAKSKRLKELANFKFQPVYFAVDSYKIDSSYFSYLARLTRLLNSNSDLRLKIIGHTDADGSVEYNLELSKNRSNALFQRLQSLGISSDRMLFEFEGESQPVGSNDSEPGKQRNRRVEFVFI
jgi:outer membrane protein OmpA-like peptidoglycan-associated protein